MITATTIATTSSPLLQGITLLVVGMGVVFVVLVTLALLIRAINVQPRSTPVPAAAAESGASSGGVPPEHLAVIAAAAHAAAGSRARVSSVVFLGHGGQRDWVAGGRATIMGSHAPRRGVGPRH